MNITHYGLPPKRPLLRLTRDLALVSAIYRSCFDDVSDDTTTDSEASSDQLHLIASAEDTLGVISVFQAWSGAYGIHIAFVPGKRRYVKEALRQVPGWIRENTPATCLMGITRDTKSMAAATRIMGMSRVGVLERALLRNGGENAVVWQRAL